MSKDYFVLRAGRVVYSHGHYDKEGALAVAKRVLQQHPKAIVRIVYVTDTLCAAPETNKPNSKE